MSNCHYNKNHSLHRKTLVTYELFAQNTAKKFYFPEKKDQHCPTFSLKRVGRDIDPVLMLEPPTPAGEPFAAVEENKSASDFESVCISLVERGWKIMPKKGTYPINKKGPRYVNLVDPRGNRKSVRVIDETLWEKLRAAEARRTGRKIDDGEAPKESVLAENSTGNDVAELENSFAVSAVEAPESFVNSAPSNSTVIDSPSPALGETSIINEDLPFTNPSMESPTAQEPGAPELSDVARTERAEIMENPPKGFQNFALSNPDLQKSIFELGFETLLSALQNESITPGEIVSKIQEWSLESKNLLEFVHNSQQKGRQVQSLPDSSEKDELISELQSTLKETEDKLAETLQALQEI
jgi:hypothetical protein